MTATIAGILSLVGTALLLILGYAIKGAIAYFGKKGAEHVHTNKDEYIAKGKEYWGRK